MTGVHWDFRAWNNATPLTPFHKLAARAETYRTANLLTEKSRELCRVVSDEFLDSGPTRMARSGSTMTKDFELLQQYVYGGATTLPLTAPGANKGSLLDARDSLMVDKAQSRLEERPQHSIPRSAEISKKHESPSSSPLGVPGQVLRETPDWLQIHRTLSAATTPGHWPTRVEPRRLNDHEPWRIPGCRPGYAPAVQAEPFRESAEAKSQQPGPASALPTHECATKTVQSLSFNELVEPVNLASSSAERVRGARTSVANLLYTYQLPNFRAGDTLGAHQLNFLCLDWFGPLVNLPQNEQRRVGGGSRNVKSHY